MGPPAPIRPNPELREALNRAAHADNALCLTCGTCDGECPVNRYSNRLRPRKIVWMANLGLEKELLESPAIWLCIACRRCTEACSESVKVHLIIERMTNLTIVSGMVASGFRRRLNEAYKTVYPRYVKQIDAILGLSDSAGSRGSRPSCASQTSKPPSASFSESGSVREYLRIGHEKAAILAWKRAISLTRSIF